MKKIYTTFVFEKCTNLLPFFNNKYENCPNPPMELRRKFEKDQIVTLLLTLGINEQGKNVALIKCPINPLPVKGEFEYASFVTLVDFLNDNGWSRIQKEYNRAVYETVLQHKKIAPSI